VISKPLMTAPCSQRSCLLYSHGWSRWWRSNFSWHRLPWCGCTLTVKSMDWRHIWCSFHMTEICPMIPPHFEQLPLSCNFWLTYCWNILLSYWTLGHLLRMETDHKLVSEGSMEVGPKIILCCPLLELTYELTDSLPIPLMPFMKIVAFSYN
jgi:hypothetical protein